MIDRLFYWWWRLTDPKGLQRYEARKAQIVQMAFWADECVRIYEQAKQAKTHAELSRLLHQYGIASRRFDKEASKPL